jgi:hypothetical protein
MRNNNWIVGLKDCLNYCGNSKHGFSPTILFSSTFSKKNSPTSMGSYQPLKHGKFILFTTITMIKTTMKIMEKHSHIMGALYPLHAQKWLNK